jgi:putative SOS response-associated peptidase YedK
VCWIVRQDSDIPMGIDSTYNMWRDAQHNEPLSFAMLTVNADGHPVFRRVHKPGEEKRMIAILDPGDYDTWLSCDDSEAP